MSKKLDFIKSLGIAVKNGFDPLIPFVHAYNESDNFMAVIGNANAYGLKVPLQYLKTHKPPFGGWDGAIVRGIMTHEEGKITEFLPQDFLDFASFDNGTEYYCFHINRVFKSAWNVRTQPIPYFNSLQKFGYFTDEDGGKTLIKLYADFRANSIYKQILDILGNREIM